MLQSNSVSGEFVPQNFNDHMQKSVRNVGEMEDIKDLLENPDENTYLLLKDEEEKDLSNEKDYGLNSSGDEKAVRRRRVLFDESSS